MDPAQPIRVHIPRHQRDADPVVRDLVAQLQAKEQAYRQLQEHSTQQIRELQAWHITWRKVGLRIPPLRWLGQALTFGKRTAGTLGRMGKLLLGMPRLLAQRLIQMFSAPVEDDSPGQLRVGVQPTMPTELVVGKGNCLVVRGWAFHPEQRIRRLRVRVLSVSKAEPSRSQERSQVVLTDRVGRVLLRDLPSPELQTRFPSSEDPHCFRLNAGFLAEIAFPAISCPAQVQITVQVDLANGRTESAVVADLALTPNLPTPVPITIAASAAPTPLVVVCMATYNPPVELFARQIASLQSQTWSRWICLIRDDASAPEVWRKIQQIVGADSRFVLRRNGSNLGFYRNFEVLLADVPPEADLVALADQDDVWDPNKLEELVRRFAPGVTLVYSDMRLVNPSGDQLAPTFWTTRENQHDNLADLLIANTITGAASMFRRRLLEDALPFPEPVNQPFHDHWLGLVALCRGEIRFVGSPLYDYVQHPTQVIGHNAAPSTPAIREGGRSLLRYLNPWTVLRRMVRMVRRPARFYQQNRDKYEHLLRVGNLARNLTLRCGKHASQPIQEALREAIGWRDGRFGWIPLLRRARRSGSERRTCFQDWEMLRGRLWGEIHRVRARAIAFLGAMNLLPEQTAVQRTADLAHHATGLTSALQARTAPLRVVVKTEMPPSINVVISIIDFKYLFGGYLTVFHLARLLVERGWRVRLILVDECDYKPSEWAAKFKSYAGLERFLDQVELVYAYDRATIIHASPMDVFLATSWWTAHVAWAATQAIGCRRFVYLIQEYEPGFYPLGSCGAFAAESYTFPHLALFSTEFLRAYFRARKLGVFAGTEGERHSVSFQNAITAVAEVSPTLLARRRTRRVLFYCRPEAHAARNLFEVGLLALRQAVREGAFRDWEFHGIGSVDVFGKLDLAEGGQLELLPRLNQEQYRRILPNYDVGLSLMWTPHPSLVPLEMAAAGLCTVTNSYANKTAQGLAAISPNLLAVEGTVGGVAQGLHEAERRAGDYQARSRGSNIRWATTWDEAFSNAVLSRLEDYFRLAAGSRMPLVPRNFRQVA